MRHNCTRTLAVASIIVALGGCSMFGFGNKDGTQAMVLTGTQVVPPNASKATGSSTISVAADRSVSGTLTTRGIVSTVAQIHSGATGINGAAIITLEKTSDSTYVVPKGANLSQAQYVAYNAGNLYLSVQSLAHPEGEIRTQLKAKHR